MVSHWGEYFDRVMKKPAEYGITNAADRCAGRIRRRGITPSKFSLFAKAVRRRSDYPSAAFGLRGGDAAVFIDDSRVARAEGK